MDAFVNMYAGLRPVIIEPQLLVLDNCNLVDD